LVCITNTLTNRAIYGIFSVSNNSVMQDFRFLGFNVEQARSYGGWSWTAASLPTMSFVPPPTN